MGTFSLNIEETANRILYPSEESKDSEGSLIEVRFFDTNFPISIKKDLEKGSLYLYILCIGYTWKKNFEGFNNYIDLARYIRLLLKLCEDFTITDLKTEDF